MSHRGHHTRSQLNRDNETISLPVISRRVRCLICNELGAREHMIQCQACRKWSHYQCTDVGSQEFISFESYRCQKCQKLAKRSPLKSPELQRQPSVQNESIHVLVPSISSSSYKSVMGTTSLLRDRVVNQTPSHVNPNVIFNRPTTNVTHSSSSSKIRVVTLLELQRLEDERLLVEEKRLRKQQTQQQIMDELISRQIEIEKQFEEDKNYLAKKCEQQVRLEDCKESRIGSSGVSSTDIFERTLEWVKDGDRQPHLTSNKMPMMENRSTRINQRGFPISRSPVYERSVENKAFRAPVITTYDQHKGLENSKSNVNEAHEDWENRQASNFMMKRSPTEYKGLVIPKLKLDTPLRDNRSYQIPNFTTSNKFETPPTPPKVDLGFQFPNSSMNMTSTNLPNSNAQVHSAQDLGIGAIKLDDDEDVVIPLTREQLASRHSLPKELDKFNGDPNQWVEFITTYTSTTKLCRYSNAENRIRLRRCLEGRAFKLVESSLLLPRTVPKAIETLRLTFGKPEDLVDTYLTKIRNMPALKTENISMIIDYSVEIENLCATLEATELHDYLNNSLLLRELTEKLPSNLKISWAIHRETLPKANLLIFGQWMYSIAQALIKITPIYKNPVQKINNRTTTDIVKPKTPHCVNTHSNVTSSKTTSSTNGNENRTESHKTSNNCENCKKDGHRIQNCYQFKGLSYQEKWDVVQKNRLCRKCLNDHHVSKCKSREICGTNGCTFKHHKLLHKSESDKVENKSDELKPTVPEQTAPVDLPRPTNFHQSLLETFFYRIAPVVINYGGQRLSTYALLDEGSSITIMDNEIAKSLNMVGKKENLCLRWTANTVRVERESERISFEISGQGIEAMKYPMKARTVNNLDLPSQSIRADVISRYRHLQNLPILMYENVKPLILIGLDNYRLTVPRECVEGAEQDPIATKCRLGWTIGGGDVNGYNSKHSINCHICECSDDKLHDMVREFFSIEYLGVRCSEPRPSNEIERSIKILENTTVRIGKRFETGLIWKYDNVNLPNNFSMALRRLDCLNKRMAKEKNIHDEVTRQLEHYINSGYARELSSQEISERSPRQWYLPIFPVIYPKKPGKVRMVFDAAAECEKISLNSVLLPGPDQLTVLPDVLRRFREGKIALNGDIREMFHQIAIRKEDQDSQRFIFGDIKKPKHFVMQVLTFGSASSPASAQYVKNKNAKEFEKEFPRAVDAIVNNHYMDDLLDSTDTTLEAIQLGKDVRFIHEHANFEMRSWLSNSTEVLQELGEIQPDTKKDINTNSQLSQERVLGMFWKTSIDTFTYSLKYTKLDDDLMAMKRKPTKREMLRVLMSIFDPLGLLSNFLVFLKILLQDIWRDRVGWDVEISDIHFVKWKRWLNLLPSVESVEIPRHYALGSRKCDSSVQLHVFVDAGQEAYGTVAYLRFESEHGVEVALDGAKSKVAPVKPMSIPRLELQAALIGARFASSIRQAHTFKIEKTFFWSDSSTVVSWLNSDLRNYSRFVGFRVAEILELTKVEEWNWISTKFNVADETTKWKKDPCFESTARWFNGPDFLRKPEDEWPQKTNTEPTTEELRTHLLIHTVVAIPFKYDTKDFSSYRKLRRAQMWALRYCYNLIAIVRGKEKITGPFSQSEYRRADNVLFRKAQSEVYAEEISILDHDQDLPIEQRLGLEPSSLIYKESPFLDENHVLRMKGRTTLSRHIPEETKTPVLLPKNHHITHLLLDHYHQRYHHHNNETVVNEVRQKFVIPRLRVMLKKVIKICQKCKNDRAVPIVPEMADLPEARLQAYVRPYSYVGLDYFGPFYVIVKKSEEKRWVMLATCMTTRAIHLEICHSMTADSFIMAFQRLCAYHGGSPLEVRSDNGTNMTGGDNELRKALLEIDWDKIQDKFTDENMKWIFNPPKASHMGGVWERLIRSVKKTLFEIMPERRPNDELLKTLMAEVQNIVNSRPLTYVPVESNLDEALTPNHFLFGTSGGSKQMGEFSEDDLILRKNWRKSQYLSELFWKRWIKEYLPTITRRTKWFKDVKNIEVGDVVIAVDDASPKNSWPKGIVLSTNIDRNGRIRSATVQTSSTRIDKNGKIHTKYSIKDRPVAKLAVLDVRPKEVSCPKDVILGGSVTDNTGPSSK